MYWLTLNKELQISLLKKPHISASTKQKVVNLVITAVSEMYRLNRRNTSYTLDGPIFELQLHICATFQNNFLKFQYSIFTNSLFRYKFSFGILFMEMTHLNCKRYLKAI